jgi:glycosyltransferase involved in cell wall biosynthesis
MPATVLESPAPSLTIVIPALNEEEAIGGTIQRCLDAREGIIHSAGLEFLEIIVVSDGSTDRTAEIAQGFREVLVVVFKTNRGYGAAIKEGFRRGKGSLLGFLDADGTCDPRTFGQLCRALQDQNADVALGSRLGPDSKMPLVRRIGNRCYAFILGLLCGRFITDTASGMRVIRKSSLKLLYPLPNGLHFTPSMSARALLNGLGVIEIPMSYEERIGRSKLSVLKDGIGFLRVIVDGVLCYRPERIFLSGFSVCLLISLLMAVYPTEFYVQNRRLEEWMIYRFLACFLLCSVGVLLLSGSALANQMATLGQYRRQQEGFWAGISGRIFKGKFLAILTISVVTISTLLVWQGIVQYLTTGHVEIHWSRVVVAAFGILLASQLLVTGVLLRVLEIWKAQGEEPDYVQDQ